MDTAPSSTYMLIFRDSSPETYQAMSCGQREQLLNQWNAWYDGLVAGGKVLGGNPLEPAGRIVSGTHGETIVDGPFAEAKEAVGGYFLLAVSGLDEATEIAQRCPNLPYGMTVEVRPVAGACHLAHSLGRTTMKEMANA